ncbi:prepilin-type N-terminal cleavage/methylation domain-containing protein [Candidatus Poribacteria bacterium]|nr:prepilin-type N-terminal cleavage/methylation domain-containing protein [Candidatus Poribacteria bacterium]
MPKRNAPPSSSPPRCHETRRANNARGRAFTLLELLIVTAIIGILAAIAVPNLLEAQVRAKVSAAKANLKVTSDALEAYAVDYARYPPTRTVIPGDPLALLSDKQLAVLTTPVAYIGPSAFRDPFGVVRSKTRSPQSLHTKRDDFPELLPPNTERSLLYFHYPSLAARFQNPKFDLHGAAVVSIGPDSLDSLGAYRPFPADFFDEEFGHTGLKNPLDTTYDPTNGTVSEGDISAFAGAARQFAVP